MIEVTDEMVEQARAAHRTSQEPDAAGQMRDVVAAVLAIVERDQKAAAKNGWDALQQCPSDSQPIPVADGETVLHCEREAGHDGAHGAMRYLTSWRDPKPTGGAS